MPQLIPQSVVDKDHKLEGTHDRSTLELAKHRWHWTIDESNPQRVTFTEYAKTVGRNRQNVTRHAKGYVLYVERLDTLPGGAAFTIHDAIRLCEQSAEMQEFSEAIAEGSGKPIAQVARGDNRTKTNEIIAYAKTRAERRGTDPVDEARKIAEEGVKSREANRRHRDRKAKAHFFRWVEIEGDLSMAQRKLSHALTAAEGVEFTEEELDFIREAVGKVRAVLNLIDLRVAGTPDIDWDAELAKLGGGVMTVRTERCDLIFSLLLKNPTGVTVDDMTAEIDTAWSLSDSSLAQAAATAIRDLRIVFGESSDVNLVCEPQGYGQRWLYRLVGTLDEASPWAGQRLHDVDSRLLTIGSVMGSIVTATKGTTRDGRRARVIERSLRRMREDLADIDLDGAKAP